MPRLDLIRLYRFAVRANDGVLADLLADAIRGDPVLVRRADRALRSLPRDPGPEPRGGLPPGLRRVLARMPG